MSREVDGAAALTRSAEPLAFTARIDANASESNDIAQRRSTLRYGLETPVGAFDQIGIDLLFAREGVWGVADGTKPYPWETIEAVANDWSTYPFAFAAVPGSELFDNGLQAQFAELSDGLDYARYAPEVGAVVSRSIVSSPWSLVVPVVLEAVAARPLTREFDAVSSKRTLELSGQFIAPNLFGRLGSTPLFSFYDTDEYQTRVNALFERAQATGLQTTIRIDQKTELFWGTTRSVSAITELTLTETDEWERELSLLLSYNWQSGYDGVESRVLPEQGTFLHTESAEIRLERTQREQSSILFRHSTAATLGENGVFSLFAGVGFSRVREPGDYWILGAEAGLELALTY
jgi:hypothetical protein